MVLLHTLCPQDVALIPSEGDVPWTGPQPLKDSITSTHYIEDHMAPAREPLGDTLKPWSCHRRGFPASYPVFTHKRRTLYQNTGPLGWLGKRFPRFVPLLSSVRMSLCRSSWFKGPATTSKVDSVLQFSLFETSLVRSGKQTGFQWHSEESYCSLL
jgi:hypothetical protein